MTAAAEDFAAVPARALWRFLEGLLDAPDPAALGARALGVRTVIPGSVSNFNEVDLERGAVVNVSDPPAAGGPEAIARYLRLRDQHPVIARLERHGADAEPLAISDLAAEEAFRASDLCALYRELGMLDQLVIPVPHPTATVTLCVGRAAWGFSEEEHAAARVVQRTLAMVYGSLLQRQSALAVEPVANDLLAGSGALVCSVDRFGDIRGVSGAAVALDPAVAEAISRVGALVERDDAQGGGEGADRRTVLLRLELRDGAGAEVTASVLHSDDGHRWPVIVRRSSGPVGPEQLVPLGLTRRQAEVMALLLQGRSAGEAAVALGISARTVQKHAEAVGRLLGVRTRTEALLALVSGAARLG